MIDNFFIDTNIFLRFLIFDKNNPQLSKNSKTIIKKIHDRKLVVTTTLLVVAELVYVLEKYYELQKTEVQEKVSNILSLVGILFEEKEKVFAALSTYVEKNVDFEDAYTYIEMVSCGITQIFTYDQKHFKRLEGISFAEV